MSATVLERIVDRLSTILVDAFYVFPLESYLIIRWNLIPKRCPVCGEGMSLDLCKYEHDVSWKSSERDDECPGDWHTCACGHYERITLISP